MTTARTSNHAKAPKAAEFVSQMRELFGEVKVEYVSEGSFVLGERGPDGVVPVLTQRKPGVRDLERDKRWQELKRGAN